MSKFINAEVAKEAALGVLLAIGMFILCVLVTVVPAGLVIWLFTIAWPLGVLGILVQLFIVAYVLAWNSRR